jgi:hypothetical protein
MSNYNYNYDDTPQKPRSRMDIWDMLSVLVLIITGCMGVFFALIYIAPESGFNPYPPSAANASPTPTITPIKLDATWTPTLPPIVTETQTLLPTLTLEPSATLLSLVTPSDTPTPTKAPKRPFSATVTYIDSTIIHPDLACNWQGVGGTVVDTNNGPILGVVIRLTGFYNSKSKDEVTVSGTTQAYNNPASFEFFLGTVPISSKEQLFVQLLDQAGLPLSDVVPVDTVNDCAKNVAVVRFKKNP